MSLDDVYHAFASGRCPPAHQRWAPHGHSTARVVEPTAHHAHRAHQKNEEGSADRETPGPLEGIEVVISSLKAGAGRDLGPTLEHRLRQALRPLSRRVRAELAAVLDDAFEVAASDEDARHQCHRLLTDPEAIEAARAVWPGLPEGEEPHA